MSDNKNVQEKRIRDEIRLKEIKAMEESERRLIEDLFSTKEESNKIEQFYIF
jgi:hypothetical protein